MAKVNIEAISTTGGTQVRKTLNEEKVRSYAEQMNDGDVFPPVVVFHDGSTYWLASGFHRLFATKATGKVSIECDVMKGTQRDAILYALSSNKHHGMPLSNEETRDCVRRMLEDEEWKGWAVREIARHIGCSAMTVSRVKGEMEPSKQSETKFVRGGKELTMNTSAISKKKPETKKKNGLEKQLEEATQLNAELEDKVKEMSHLLEDLEAENEKLRGIIAVGQWDATEIEKIDVQDTLNELHERIKILEHDNVALRDSRDMFQARNAELIRSNKSMAAKLKVA
jgi:DNA-binding transcriptional regulator YhcF (GntR family)